MSIETQEFGKLPSGEKVSLFTLTNQHGLKATITNYGGILVSLQVPDKHGTFADIVLGKDTLADYLAGHPHFSAITGRVAGRIADAEFTLDGETYPLEANFKNVSTLHGGLNGFDKILWNASIIDDACGNEKLRLQTIDPDGNNGFPGTVNCTVTYALLEDDTLEITYEATTDKATPFNITNHAYFNLGGHDSGDVLHHSLQIFADAVAPTDDMATLLGHRAPVVANYNDFREPIVLKDLKTLDAGNADIHFFLDGARTPTPKPAAIVSDTRSGRTLEVLTTEPGVQFYAGLSLSEEGPETGKGGVTYPPLNGLCLETQDYADTVHHPDMGGAILRPDQPFKSTTLFRFSAK